MSCKPIVNRTGKMVPEGGFEPPTRGFSILLQPLKNNDEIVNYAENSLNGINSLQSGCKPTNAQILSDLTHARCVFQLATICCVLGSTEIPKLCASVGRGDKGDL